MNDVERRTVYFAPMPGGLRIPIGVLTRTPDGRIETCRVPMANANEAGQLQAQMLGRLLEATEIQDFDTLPLSFGIAVELGEIGDVPRPEVKVVETIPEAKSANFMAQCLRGEALPIDVQSFIDAWVDGGHACEQWDFLGMSQAEFRLFKQYPWVLKRIINARRNGTDLQSVRENLAVYGLAARSSKETNKETWDWLKKMGWLDQS